MRRGREPGTPARTAMTLYGTSQRIVSNGRIKYVTRFLQMAFNFCPQLCIGRWTTCDLDLHSQP